MIFNINFGLKLSAGALSLLCFFLGLKNFHLRSIHLLPYLALVLNIILCSAVSATLSYYEIYPEGIRDAVRDVLENIYTYIHDFLPYLLLLYMFHIFSIHYHQNKILYVVTSLPLFFLEIAVTINFFYPILYRYQDHSYQRLDGWISLVLVTALYYLATYFFTYLHRKALPLNSYHFLVLAYSLPLIGIAVQFFAHIKAELFGEALSLLILYFSLESNDGEIDFSLDSYNEEALFNEIRGRVNMKQPFTLIDIRLLSIDGTFSLFSPEEKRDMALAILKEIKKLYRPSSVYVWNEERYYLCLRKSKEECNEDVTRLRQQVEKDYLLNASLTISVKLSITLLSYPDPLANEDELFRYLLNPQETSLGEEKKEDNPEENFYHRKRSVLIGEAIQNALDNNRFTLDYQPIYPKDSSTPVALETFLRLEDPILGKISPAEIFPIAKQNGSLPSLGERHLEIAASFYAKNHLEQYGIKHIFVKISEIELYNEALPEIYQAILSTYSLEPSLFALEVNERETSFSDTALKSMLKALQDDGFPIVYDNFGDDSTNLIQLLSSSIEGVKIDRKILWEAMEDDNRRLLLKNILKALKNNGKTIYQSGVETKEEEEFALTYAVDYLQGYYFSHPLPEKEILPFLAKGGRKA
ncbi:MAG: EAL domain-containing protein [Eubacteriales bacterium]|nr:EAL domain-containing protein [Eubacteriales bacterium]